jgi:hypothetical protein
MPQVTIRRPFGELDLGDRLRFESSTVFISSLPVSSVRLGPRKNFGSHVFNDKKVAPAVAVGGGDSQRNNAAIILIMYGIRFVVTE